MQKPDSANPVLAEATRGAMVESRYRAAIAVVDTAGTVVLKAGDIDRLVYPRSAIKPLQALPLVETGAMDAYGLGDRELALACASHTGEAMHVDAVTAWLRRLDLDATDLECGAQLPLNSEASRGLLASGEAATRVHNNCSGKHTGFLTVARRIDCPTKGYIRYEHPVQQRVLGVLEQMTGMDLGATPRGIDGCGIPVIAVPLGNIALAMARLADPADQPDRRQEAAPRIRAAMAAHPELVGGTDRFDTMIMRVTGDTAIVKVGAQGVYCAALAEPGLGVALKVDDGNATAAEVIMGAVLRRLDVLSDSDAAGLADVLRPPIRNHDGDEVGRMRICEDASVWR